MLCLCLGLIIILGANTGCHTTRFQPGRPGVTHNLVPHPHNPDMSAFWATFLGKRWDERHDEIVVYDHESRTGEVLISGMVAPPLVGWHPDGQKILLVRGLESTNGGPTGEYVYFDVEARRFCDEPVAVTTASWILSPALSPTGRYIADIRLEREEGGRRIPNVWVTDLQTDTCRQLTRFNSSDWCASGTSRLSWSSDEDQIAFCISDYRWKKNQSPGDERASLFTVSRLALVDVSDGRIHVLTSGNILGANDPAYSPKGNLIAYLEGEGTSSMWNTSLHIRMPQGRHFCILKDVGLQGPRWSADMRHIFASKDRRIIRVPVPNHIREEALREIGKDPEE